MTSITISDLITDRLSETENALTSHSDTDWAGAKERATAMAKIDLYGVEKDESDIGDARIKRYIAVLACLDLIELGIDYFISQSRLSESKDNANFSYYDKVAALQNKRDEYREWLQQTEDRIRELLEGDAGREGIDISTLHPDRTAHKGMATPSPWGRRPK